MNFGNKKDILVFIEQNGGKMLKAGIESITPAITLGHSLGGKVTSLLIGTENQNAVKRLAGLGADKIVSVKGPSFSDGCSDAFFYALSQMAEKYDPAAVLAADSPLGRELTARLSALKSVSCIHGALGLHMQDTSTPVWTLQAYGGSIMNDVAPCTAPFTATVRSGAFRKPEASGQKAEITEESVTVPKDVIRSQVIKSVKEISEEINLEDAKAVVSGGRGMGSKENFKLVEELADVLGGVVGATRPAIESGWVSRAHQVGQSGKTVKPALYIACGISGAVQHISGMEGSGYIVAVNKDEDAPIFDIADAGIVGDAMQVLPVMIEEIKKRKTGAN
mgnify:FL=1